MFEIHHSARANFDAKAEKLVDLIEETPRKVPSGQRYDTDVHIVANITEEDIIGTPKEAATDYRGNTVARYLSLNGKRYGLTDSAHEELVKVAEAVQRLPAFRDKLSRKFVEEVLFSWLEKRFIKKDHEQLFLDTLVEKASDVVKPITINVPIANTIVETPFRFCGYVIKNLSKVMIDKMATTGQSMPNEENRKSLERFTDDFRKKYQGYAVIELELECEPDYATEFSLQTANRITDLLGIYSGAVLMPDVKCVSRPKGSENIAQYTTIIVGEDCPVNVVNGILDKSSSKTWFISKSDLDSYVKCGLGVISSIAEKEKVSDFESAVLNMTFLYSKSAFTSDPLEKLVYMLSALEATLLKNESEPIQQNIAERMALFISNDLQNRKDIIRNLKKVYGFRSRYLHHGHSVSELDELSTFFFNVWLFFVQLVANIRNFKDKDDFINAIDDHKLG